MDQKPSKMAKKLIFLDFLKGGAFAPVAPPLDPPLPMTPLTMGHTFELCSESGSQV